VSGAAGIAATEALGITEPLPRSAASVGLLGYTERAIVTAILSGMESSVAEDLPALYRAVLDRVAELEATGDRIEARRIRAEAIRIYSRAWNQRAQRRLQSLLRRTYVRSVEVKGARGAARGFSTTV